MSTTAALSYANNGVVLADRERHRADAELAFERHFDPNTESLVVLEPRGEGRVEADEFKLGLESALLYAGKSVAEATLAAYRSSWRQFFQWAQASDRPVLPAPADAVAAYLAALADGGYAYGTIALRLAAINFVHKLGGWDKPGDDEFVRRVLAGIRRTIGTRPQHARDAIGTERARRIVAVTYESCPAGTRDAVLSLFGLGHQLGASALSRLDWDDIEVTAERISVRTHDGTRAGTKVEMWISDPQELELLSWLLVSLRDRYDADRTHVFDNGRGRRMSPSGIAKVLRRLGDAAPEDTAGHAHLHTLCRLVETSVATQQPIDIRDRAIILIGLVSAMRRSNLAALQWRDFELVEGGLQVTLRRSKTDQDGAGFEVIVPYGSNPRTCPVRAFETWRSTVEQQRGADPMDASSTEAFFTPVDRHGNVSVSKSGRAKPLSGHHINRIVAERAEQAGLVGNFGAHSLRVGFVTSAAAAGAQLHEIAEQTGHVSLDVLRGYIRVQQKWDNPAASRLEL